MKIRSSEEQVVPVIKKYIGIGNFKVVGINSTLAQLEELGFNYKQEPNYKVTIGDDTYSKAVFYVRNEELNINNKLEFLINNKTITFSTGSQKFVNDLGQSSIGQSLQECLARTGKGGGTFFKDVNARPAKQGEVELLEFLVAWFNIKNFVTQKETAEGIAPDTVIIDFNKLVAGDISELRGYLSLAKDNEVKLMITVVNDYSVVYNRYFDRASSNLNNFSRYISNQEKAGYPPKGDYLVGDLVEFTGSFIKPDSDDAVIVPTF